VLAATVEELGEIHLAITNLSKMRYFYLDLFGFEEDFYHEGEMVGLRTPGCMLVLVESETGASGVSLVLHTGISSTVSQWRLRVA